jgi:hypothetical protein
MSTQNFLEHKFVKLVQVLNKGINTGKFAHDWTQDAMGTVRASDKAQISAYLNILSMLGYVDVKEGGLNGRNTYTPIRTIPLRHYESHTEIMESTTDEISSCSP